MSTRSYIVIFALILLGLFILFIHQYNTFNDKKLHVVFCDVGQGDGAFIRTPNGKTILIDGGPDASVLECLASHMPFWQRTIDLVLLTHPHNDHFVGLFDVFDRYAVRAFATEKLTNPTQSFVSFKQTVTDEKIAWQELTSGAKFRLADGVSITILGPSPEYLLETSPNGAIGEKQEFASLIILVSYGDFRVLFTGDSQASGIHDALNRDAKLTSKVLHVPHHGSKTGLDEMLLQTLNPSLAVISVGRKNRYGHPAKITTDLLHTQNIRYLRTDQMGTIEIITDGKEWRVRQRGE